MNKHTMRLREQILESMARTLFVMAYASAIDNGQEGFTHLDRAGPGEDWMEVAPDAEEFYPRAAREARALAEKMLEAFEQLNQGSMTRSEYNLKWLLEEWNAATGHDSEPGPGACHVFGHYIAMQSLGTGVGLNDDTGPGARKWKTGYFEGINL